MSVRIKKKDDLKAIKKAYQELNGKYKHQILVCAGAGCVSSDCYVVRDAVLEQIKALSLDNSVKVYGTGASAHAPSDRLCYPRNVFLYETTAETAQRL